MTTKRLNLKLFLRAIRHLKILPKNVGTHAKNIQNQKPIYNGKPIAKSRE